jgi:hypothetical protein
VTAVEFSAAIRAWLVELELWAAGVARMIQRQGQADPPSGRTEREATRREMPDQRGDSWGKAAATPPLPRARRIPARPDSGCRRTLDPACRGEAEAVKAGTPATTRSRNGAERVASLRAQVPTGRPLARSRRRIALGQGRPGDNGPGASSPPVDTSVEAASVGMGAAQAEDRVGGADLAGGTPAVSLQQGTTDGARPPHIETRLVNREARAAARPRSDVCDPDLRVARPDHDDRLARDTAESVGSPEGATPTSPAETSGVRFTPATRSQTVAPAPAARDGAGGRLSLEHPPTQDHSLLWSADHQSRAPGDARLRAHFSPRFCASCTDERDDLVVEDLDGRRVHLCPDCASGELRSGRWSFAGGRDANGILGERTDGNRRIGTGRG